MKPLKLFLFVSVLFIVALPFTVSAESGLACTNKSDIAVGTGIFKTAKANFHSDFFKKADRKKRLAKAHRKDLLKKARKRKF
ncbi:DEAD/DEAH box helicase family protein [Pontibacter burrus]|nr:hypothetical protein [Pontibacter burrus]